MPKTPNLARGLCLLIVVIIAAASCQPHGNQAGRAADTSAAVPAAAQLPPLKPPEVNFPAERNPSWITSAHPQEPQDEQAVADLKALGFEFGGKQFVEQAIAGNQHAVELFLKGGIDPNTRSLGGTTALMGAVTSGNLDLVKLLVEHGADATLREARTTEMTALLYAAQNGFTEIAAYLIDHGADPSECDSRLETGLYKAVMEQHEDLVQLLLEHGADVDARAMRLTTPLTYGTGYPSLAIVKLLVEAGADVDAVDSSGSTPLLVAAKFGRSDTFFYLLDRGATNFGQSLTGYNCLHAAAESGAVDIATELLKRGFNVNQPDGRTAFTPLLIAVAHQRLELASWLLENGADPRPRCIFGYSALDLIRRLHTDCADRTAEERERDKLPDLEATEKLLRLAERAAGTPAGEKDAESMQAAGTDQSADLTEETAPHPSPPRKGVGPATGLPQPSLDDSTLAAINSISDSKLAGLSQKQAKQVLKDHGIAFTPDIFIETCVFGWPKLFRIFLAAGIDPNAQRDDGGNAITAACLRGDANMVRTLIDHGADLSSTFGENQSPCMHFAALSHQTAVVDLLLEHGQDVDVRDLGGRTALMRSLERADSTMAAHLLDKGADVNAADKRKLTPLLWAVRSGNLDIVKLLVDHGAKLEQADERGIPPVYAAAMQGNWEVYKYLSDLGAPVDIASDDGTSMIHAAVFGGNRRIVKDLLARGQDINARHPVHGITPIFGVLDRREADPEFIRFLLDNGAKVNLFDDVLGYSPLMLAAMNSNVAAFNLLIDHGADYNAANDKGLTVLDVAVMDDSPEMVNKLLDLGVDVSAKDKAGKTALDYAVENHCNRVEPILRKAMGLPAKETAAGGKTK